MTEEEFKEMRKRVQWLLTIPALLILCVIYNTVHYPPSFELKKFYIPALDKSLNSSKDATIAFDITLKKFSIPVLQSFNSPDVYYDPINVTFYDSPSQDHSIANFTVPEFDLIKDEIEYWGMVNTTGLDLDGAKREISANGFKVFRVGLETSVTYNYYNFWKTKRYGYREGVDVKIGDTGAAAKFGNNFVGIRALLMFNFMVLVFLSSY
ncbi:Protein NDR1 [Carex littledalei]|uniref:Protein NDR1 n=1 Tax=Carex littledalei TaxID=544730 RepID=A0A833VRD7_9POAL|nr:Protein NDR1 [Carex littledalei]